MRKRRIRIFPVVSLVLFAIIVAFAVGILIKTFSPKPIETNEEENEREEIIENNEEEETVDTPDEQVEVVAPIPEDTTVVFEDNAPKPEYTQEELLSKFPDTVLSKTQDAGQTYINDIIFIGDSTTHGMAFYGVLEGGKNTTQVWTPKSGTLAMWNLLTENIVYPDDDSEMLIYDAIAIKKPKMAVLTLGVNGVSSLEEGQFKKYYTDLILKIKENSPETKIILQSIYPVCDYYEMKSISMEKINRANLWIVEIASENSVNYLNTITVLVNEKGYLNNDYCNGDGIHISKEGFGVILDYIKTHAIQ
jgi:lysophospholipase L1-like esterase